jgi:hypothetical protein
LALKPVRRQEWRHHRGDQQAWNKLIELPDTIRSSGCGNVVMWIEADNFWYQSPEPVRDRLVQILGP